MRLIEVKEKLEPQPQQLQVTGSEGSLPRRTRMPKNLDDLDITKYPQGDKFVMKRAEIIQGIQEGGIRPASLGETVSDSMAMRTLVREESESEGHTEEENGTRSRLSTIECGLSSHTILMRDPGMDEEMSNPALTVPHTRRAQLNAIERTLETIAARLGIYGNGSDAPPHAPPPSYTSGPNR
jgi:hypothetical protein